MRKNLSDNSKSNSSLLDSHADRSVGEKKPRTSGDEEPSMIELSGYNFKRQEFEIEYDNDAEQLLADMEFKDTDTDVERELKLRVLHIYLKRKLLEPLYTCMCAHTRTNSMWYGIRYTDGQKCVKFVSRKFI